MTRTEHLLTILAEECAELAQRTSKALRFGLDETQPGQPLTNAERMQAEMADLLGVWKMLSDEESLSSVSHLHGLAVAKAEKVEKSLVYSRELGMLSGR